MAVGIKFKNEFYENQIDGDYKNFMVWEHGSYAHSGGCFTLDFSDTPYPPILAVKPIEDECVAVTYVNRSIWTGLYNNAWIEVQPGAAAGSLDYAIFTEYGSGITPDYGMIVKNAKGEKVFSSGEIYLKIIDVTLLNFDPKNTQTITPVNVNNYFLMTCYNGRAVIAQSEEIFIAGFKKVSDVIRARYNSTADGGRPGSAGTNFHGHLIEIAVD